MDTMKLLILISKKYLVWRKRFIFSKSLIFIWCLTLTYSFVEYRVVAILIDSLSDIWGKENLRKAAIFTNLQDGLSSLFIIPTHVFAAYGGLFGVVFISTSAYIMGLMLLWGFAWRFPYDGTLIAGILLTALGGAGVPTLRGFLEFQVKEIVRERKQSTGEVNGEWHRQVDIREEEDDQVVRVNIWWRSARISGAILSTFLPHEKHWPRTFRHAALAMASSSVLFLSGCNFYVLGVPTGTPLSMIFKVFKVALRKSSLDYPDSDQSWFMTVYYWKDIEPTHPSNNTGGGQVKLSPHVPHLWRWLDKAAIIRESPPPQPSPERQETKGDLCSVKEVREVKRFAFFIHLCLTLLPYCMVVAAGNTFFVEQATNNLRLTFNIQGLFLLKSIARDVVIFFIWSSKLTTQKWIKVRIGVGMALAVICCVAAFLVEHRRLTLVKENSDNVLEEDEEIGMGIEILIPQFLLLGLMEALVDNGLEDLYDNYVPESLGGFGEPFIELTVGIGKLLTIPCVLFTTSWFKESMNTSHVDRYYLMLAILNSMFVIIYGYYSTKYKQDYPEDEELGMDRSEEITQENGQEESQEEAIIDFMVEFAQILENK